MSPSNAEDEDYKIHLMSLRTEFLNLNIIALHPL